MIRFRKVTNPNLEANIRLMSKVREIIQIQFPAISQKNIDEIGQAMIHPFKYKYHSTLFIAEDIHETIKGFALLLHFSDQQICYLDYIAVSPGRSSSGLGGAIYERVREEAASLNAFGIFFECLPDDPDMCRDKSVLAQNEKRLAFYERFGARPIANTLYELPVNPEDDCPPYLMFDGLGKNEVIPREKARKIIQAILERVYRDYCSSEYTKKVVSSIEDDPVTLRPPKYTRRRNLDSFKISVEEKNKILCIVNNRHSIHHVKERGYVESPVRIENILKELDKTGLFKYITAREYPEKFITDVHDIHFFNYFKKICKNLPEGKSVYPYVFPIRNSTRAPVELSVRAGYYCFDTFTPINQNAFLAARWGVNCVLTACDAILSGNKAAYVLTRPPGHHAERSVFGGFCYFNNCAIAANYLSSFGNVAILDIDYHHGNGQQQIFYHRNDVLTISIHGHPSFAYPYFSGFEEEKGEEKGHGFNFNFPLAERITYDQYSKTLKKAINLIQDFKPEFLILALGFDAAKKDPTGTWDFISENFQSTGKLIGSNSFQTLIIQEGGYKNQSLGINARNFFNGFYDSHYVT